MPEAARVEIPVSTGAAAAARDLGKLDRSLLSTTAAAKKNGAQLDKTAKSTSGLNKAFTGLGKYLAAGALILGFKKLVDITTKQQQSIAQLNAVIKSTGGVAGVTSEQMQGLAGALQKVSLYGDEEIISAESLLLTFTKIGKDVIPDATKAILNMSQAMGQDLKSSTVQVGKALNDPIAGISALSRVGVQLTDDQKNLIKSFVEMGDVASAQKVILGELETQFGGAAEAATNTLGGAFKQLSNVMGDSLEVLGEGLTPGFVELAHAMRDALQEGGVLQQGLSILGESLGFLAHGLSNIINLFNIANKQMKLKDAQRETADLIAGMEGIRDQAKIALGVVSSSQSDVLKKLREIVKTDADPRRVKIAQDLINKYKEQTKQIQGGIDKQNSLISEQEGIVDSINRKFGDSTNKMNALTSATNNANNATKNVKLTAEEYAKVLSEARGILAGAGDTSAFLAQQRAGFAEQIKTVKQAGLDVSSLEKFQQQQRINQLSDFFGQAANDESKSFDERQRIIDEQYKAIADSEATKYEEKLAAQQAYNMQSQALERSRLQSFASGVALAGSALTDLGAIAGSISQIQQNQMEAEIAALEKKGATQEEIEAKRAQLARKAAKDQKRLSLFAIAVNTSVAVIKTLAEYGYTPLGIGLSILAGAKGIAEAAAVASTPIPAAQFGGSFTVPPGNEADSGLVSVNQGEQVDVTPTRFSNGNDRQAVYLMLDNNTSFRGYLTKEIQSIMNSGNVQVWRAGAIKTA